LEYRVAAHKLGRFVVQFLSFFLVHVTAGADWDQKDSAAIGFIKETLWKNPHITLKKSLNSTRK
jgi:hypothetical protein